MRPRYGERDVYTAEIAAPAVVFRGTSKLCESSRGCEIERNIVAGLKLDSSPVGKPAHPLGGYSGVLSTVSQCQSRQAIPTLYRPQTSTHDKAQIMDITGICTFFR